MNAWTELLSPFWENKPSSSKLDNGLELLVKQDFRHALCSIQFWVPTGSIHEGACLGSGLSHFLEHMVFKGSSKYSGKKAVEMLHGVGGSVNAYTSIERTVYHVELPSSALALGLEILGDMVFKPILDPSEINKERQVILREIDMCEDEPESKLSRLLFETAFRVHPYRFPVIGYPALLKKLSAQDLKAYHAKYYTPNRVKIVIAGAVDPEECLALAQRYYGSLPRGFEDTPTLPTEPLQLGPREVTTHGDYELARGFISFKVPGITHSDAPGLDALAHALGYGYSSPLWQALREGQCLVQSIDASVWNPGQSGLFSIGYTCDPDKHSATQKALMPELAKILAAGFTQEKIDQYIRHFVVSEINAHKSIYGQASRIGFAYAIMGDPHYLPFYLEKLQALRPTDLQALGQRYLVPQTLTQAYLSPTPKKNVSPKPVVKAEPFSYQSGTLSNGLRFLTIPNKELPKMHVTLASLGGPLFEESPGATYLLSTLLTKDTQKHTAQQVATQLESYAMSFNDFCGNNSFGVSAEALSLDQERLLDTLKEAILEPAFSKATLERERDAQLADIAEEAEDGLSLTLRRLRERFFKGHPYAIEPIGSSESVKTLTQANLQDYYKKQCVGPNTVVAITGDYTTASVDSFLQALNALPASPLVPKAHPFTAPQSPHESSFTLEREQAIFTQAYAGVGLRHKDFFASEVLEELFSSMSSKLFFTVREERSLAYFVGAGRIKGLDTGMFYFYAGIQNAAAPKLAQAVQAEIQRVQSGQFLPGEIERAQQRLITRKHLSLQRLSERGMQAALNSLYGLPIDEAASYIQGIRSVNAAGLQAFAKEYLVNGVTLSMLTKE